MSVTPSNKRKGSTPSASSPSTKKIKVEQRKITDEKLLAYQKHYAIKADLFACITKEMMTDVDRRTYLPNKFPAFEYDPVGITSPHSKEITDKFLKLIDTDTTDIKKNKGNILLYYQGIAYFLMKLDPETVDLQNTTTHPFAPANRLYFILLANIYCYSKEYFENYPWLTQLLSIFEQTGLTGEFKLTETAYNELFAERGHGKRPTIKSDLPFFVKKMHILTKAPIYDYNYKSLSNSSIASVVGVSSAPPLGWKGSKAKEEKIDVLRRQAEDKAEIELKKLSVSVAAPPPSVSVTAAPPAKSVATASTPSGQCPYGSQCGYYKHSRGPNVTEKDIKHVRSLHPQHSRHLQHLPEEEEENTSAGGKKNRKRSKKGKTRKNKKSYYKKNNLKSKRKYIYK